VEGVMTGHVMYPALDNKTIATFSKPILQDLLRGEMGFNGLIVTDSLDMKGATSYCTIAGCAVRALAVGTDMVLLGRYIRPVSTYNQIWQKVQEEKLQPRIDEAAKRVFRLKERLGLLEQKPSVPAPSELAYQAELAKLSDEAVTLVRDREHKIPFHPDGTRNAKPTVCAVFFAPARFADQLMGLSRPFLEHGWTVRSYNAALTPKKKDSQRAAQCASGADLLIVTSLQWADKTNINQKNAITGLLRENENVVFISTMSPYDIPQYPQAGTVLATYGLNKYVLQTAARIILGDLKAHGILPVILPSSSEDVQPQTHISQVKQKSQ